MSYKFSLIIPATDLEFCAALKEGALTLTHCFKYKKVLCGKCGDDYFNCSCISTIDNNSKLIKEAELLFVYFTDRKS